jgi:hypothetical protein
MTQTLYAHMNKRKKNKEHPKRIVVFLQFPFLFENPVESKNAEKIKNDK